MVEEEGGGFVVRAVFVWKTSDADLAVLRIVARDLPKKLVYAAVVEANKKD